MPPATIQTSSTLGAAVDWIAGTLLGTVGTAIAVVSIAWLGFEMLGGRLSLRRGGAIILGCFVMFGAPTIATALMDLTRGGSSVAIPRDRTPQPMPLPPAATAPPAVDPYAGASVG